MNLEQFKQQIEEKVKHELYYDAFTNGAIVNMTEADLRDYTQCIISLTADMFVGEEKYIGKEEPWTEVRMRKGYNTRISEERALAEQIKSIK